MRSKILTGAMALALAATTGLATTAPASAHYARGYWNPGYAYAPGYTYRYRHRHGTGDYGQYNGSRYTGYRYYGPGRHGHCFQTCPDRNGSENGGSCHRVELGCNPQTRPFGGSVLQRCRSRFTCSQDVLANHLAP
jgi:hypothetical protein